PLQHIGRSVSSTASTPFKGMILGVIFTENTKKAMKLPGDVQSSLSQLGVFTNRWAVGDANASLLATMINEVLQRRFKEILVLSRFEERAAAPIDAVMFLDVQIAFGTVSGTQTRVALQGIFVDEQQTPIEQLRGDGTATIPYPAFSFNFKPAATQAVERFA